MPHAPECQSFDNFAKQGDNFPVVSGDMVVHLKNILPLGKEKLTKKELTDSSPVHGTVVFDQTLMHSTSSAYQVQGSMKTKYGTIFDGVQTTEFYSWKKKLGEALVLHCIDKELAENIQKFLLIYKNLPTPYSYPGARRADQIKNIEHFEHLEFFRAFRVFVRLNQENPQPISKLSAKPKGVSCSGFVSYIFKASIIAKFFPNGLPDELMILYTEIEEERKKQTNGKKLDGVNSQLLKLFEATALDCLNREFNKLTHKSDQKDDGVEFTQKKEKFDLYVKELKRPVKNATIAEFTYNAVQSPLWNAGIYCYDKEKNKSFMISYELYQKAYARALMHPNSVLTLSELSETMADQSNSLR